MNSPSLPRYRHRKRISALRLSSDSVAPLPAYTSPPAHHFWQEDPPSDRPPDYPDSASEADADTEDFESDQVYAHPPLSPPPLSPRRYPRRHSSSRIANPRRRLTSASDPHLDSLLERSVHALELSNALLQSSMSTQSSLSTLLAPDSPADQSLQARARVLSSRIGQDVHDVWMEDLEEITKGVDRLFGEHASSDDERSVAGPSTAGDSSTLVSSSLPSISSIRRPGRGRRRPSLDFRNARTESASSDAGQLNYSNHDRRNLVATAPRALTLYVDSTDDPSSILLPSTLGLRASSSSYFPDTSSSSTDINASAGPTRRSHSHSLHSLSQSRNASSDQLDHQPELSTSSSTTKAYDLLSSVAKRNASPPVRSSGSRSRSITPRRHHSPPPLPRPMTPPIEELSSASTASSTDSQPDVSRTVQTLRKILNEQPKPPAEPPVPSKRPSFLPKSAPPAPAIGTSNATASVSRLFTKGTHHSSTRPPSPPKHSSLKQRSAPSTPVTPAPSLLSINTDSSRSATSSGRSTPKRISFAELPESYGQSKPGGSESSKYPSKRSRKGPGVGRKDRDRSDAEGGSGWWTGWLLGASGSYGGAGMSLSVERAEDRAVEAAGRGWGGKARFGGPLDEWGI
ncbi:hypothetical protein GLOTRDRAFT_113866, partial [Gloeophyllum trabeum ATCC 11539]